MGKTFEGTGYYLRRARRLVFSRPWVILEALTVAATIAYLASQFLIAPTYEAVARITVSAADNDENSRALLDECADAVGSRPVLEEVIDSLGLGYSYEELRDMVAVKVSAASRRLTVTVKHAAPILARDLANTISETACAYIAETKGTEVAKVADSADTPPRPASPNIRLNTVVGGLLGIVLVAITALLVAVLDDSCQSDEDLHYHLDLHAMAVVPPDISNRRGAKNEI
jgi:capsular polysaccharide biosynthesis protein